MLDFQNVCGYYNAIEDELELSVKGGFPPPPALEEDFDDDDDDATEGEPYSIAYTSCSSTTAKSRSSRSRNSNEDREDDEAYYEPGRCHGGACTASSPRNDSPSSRKRKSSIRNVIPPHPTVDTPNLMEDSIFEILSPQNNSDDEADAQVLSPEVMEGMQSHFPIVKKGESFWLQYSLVRDGASMESLLWKTRNTEHSVLAIETVDGEIFGAFTTQKWHTHHDFYGSRESFLWRWNGKEEDAENQKPTTTEELDEEALEFFHFSHLNEDVQLCTPDRLAVGGGIRKFDPEYGFGISLDRDLLSGTTNKCMTFLSPPLSKVHADGSTFDVRNLEVWALTPCLSLADAEKVQNKEWT